MTNYHLHKALYSGHNDHNYFEIAHTVKRLQDMGVNRNEGCMLYNFTDNHDVERIFTKLNNKAHFVPVHVLLYTLPGIPSIYYGSEFAIEGKKEKFSDASLRPCMKAEDYEEDMISSFFGVLSTIRSYPGVTEALSSGGYRQIVLTNRQYVFARETNDRQVYIAVNNDENEATVRFNAESDTLRRFILVSGADVKGEEKSKPEGGLIKTIDIEEIYVGSVGNRCYEIKLPPCSGAIFMAV